MRAFRSPSARLRSSPATDRNCSILCGDTSALARLDAHATPDGTALATLARLDDAGHALARLDADAATAEHAQIRLEPQRYKVQFEASEEYVELVERAKALV